MGVTEDAAPLPQPKKLTSQDISDQSQPSNHLGSAWNRAGTWEEKNLNKWATDRIKELLISVGSLEFSDGSAEISEVSKCVGNATLVTVRNKKRVGYSYEITMKVKGEWHFGEERKKIKGHLELPEFSFGELDDLEAGTWEEKNLNKLATDRIKELLISVGSLEFSDGSAEISEVSKCVGDHSVFLPPFRSIACEGSVHRSDRIFADQRRRACRVEERMVI